MCFLSDRETELFPKGALEYYTKKNMGWEYTQEEYDTWQLAERGGEQGDYRDGVSIKSVNLVAGLESILLSKVSRSFHVSSLLT